MPILKPLVALVFSGTVLTALAIGCSSKDSPATGGDAGMPAEAGPCVEATTTAPGACTPSTCATGNSKHIGAFCTKGGDQCAGYAAPGTSLFCAIDLDPRGKGFCMKLGCQQDSDCGEKACCREKQACIPSECGCDSGEDAGADAAADAGMDAASDADGG